MTPRTPIVGLHHVTATVGDSQADLDFCIGVLGLRLVKKTVNFDNHNVYHFYYGDERGSPGTIWTTFPYAGWGVPVGAGGAGQIAVTSFSVPADSLGPWQARLAECGVPVEEVEPRFGEPALRLRDRSGLVFELIGSDRDARAPWTGGGVPADAAIRGLHGITMVVRDPGPSLELLVGVLGFEVLDEAEARTRVSVGGDAPGRTIDVVRAPDAPAALNGLGTVHHVALAIADADEQRRLRAELVSRGLQVTEVRNRQYFQSIYFREPGGVLLEVATVQPGFTLDEDPARLGCALKLPPWEEPHRAAIEARLPAVVHG
ncbi:MAG TPA: ring-cleaving dioxygenase [Gemmatimonadales bacterium]|nr:ring-cleaving dioxygenase [Gemmatimonadales bacterium]